MRKSYGNALNTSELCNVLYQLMVTTCAHPAVERFIPSQAAQTHNLNAPLIEISRVDMGNKK